MGFIDLTEKNDHTSKFYADFLIIPFVAALSNSANDEDIPESVKQAAKGALWVIEGKDEKQRSSSSTGNS